MLIEVTGPSGSGKSTALAALQHERFTTMRYLPSLDLGENAGCHRDVNRIIQNAGLAGQDFARLAMTSSSNELWQIYQILDQATGVQVQTIQKSLNRGQLVVVDGGRIRRQVTRNLVASFRGDDSHCWASNEPELAADKIILTLAPVEVLRERGKVPANICGPELAQFMSYLGVAQIPETSAVGTTLDNTPLLTINTHTVEPALIPGLVSWFISL